jgi:hypothetical protein
MGAMQAYYATACDTNTYPLLKDPWWLVPDDTTRV